MEQRISLTTLGVADIGRAKAAIGSSGARTLQVAAEAWASAGITGSEGRLARCLLWHPVRVALLVIPLYFAGIQSSRLHRVGLPRP